MSGHTVTLSIDRQTETATLVCNANPLSLTLKRKNGFCETFTGADYFQCLANMRRATPGITFLCKGAKLNVYPSRMTSQMAEGMVAYEVTLGVPAGREHLVKIFDFDDRDICSDPDEQTSFFAKWRQSLKDRPAHS